MEHIHCSEFEAEAHAAGFEEVLDPIWAPLTLLGTQAHPFAAQARVVAGEMRLTQGGSNRQLRNADCLLLRRDGLLLDRCARSLRSSVSRGNTGTLAR